jgi:CRISPR-associated protein Csm1
MPSATDSQMLVLGGLLHDIGKFKQRAGMEEDKGKTHAQIGYEWLATHYDEGIVAATARNDHGNEPETWQSNLSLVVYEADNCAATERRTRFAPQMDIGKKWHRQVQLASVFSRVRNPAEDTPKEDAVGIRAFHALAPLGDWVEPSPVEGQNSTEDYRKLWQAFEEEFDSVKGCNNHTSVAVMLHLLEKYTSFIPSITLKVYSDSAEQEYRKHPDVSLFDHLKTTAAAALCLERHSREQFPAQWSSQVLKEEITGESSWATTYCPFLLIGGDISGIQRFIYTLSSKGALKTLKGRSFFLELFTEHVVDRLIEELQLSPCNIIFTGGGHFYLIAPNIDAAKHAVQNVRQEVNAYLLDEFNGALQQFIEWIPFGKSDFKDVTLIWSGLSRRLEQAKQKKWGDHIPELLAGPQMPHDECLTANCEVCGREDRPLSALTIGDPAGQTLVCPSCRTQFDLGTFLQDATRRGASPVIYRWDEKPVVDRYVRIGQRYYQPAAGVFGKGKANIVANASAVLHLNDWILGHFTHPASRPLFAGAYLPDDEGCRDLQGMAVGGFGMERLGVLRLDVDHLGRIFSASVPPGERTFSRMASLSRQLSLFFKYYLNSVLECRESYPPPFRAVDRGGERRVSVVYSGGDDLFLIGHWLDVTEAAVDIRNAFTRFTANPYITVSAGIALGDSNDPVYRLAEEAGHAEQLAKNNGRCSITLFNNQTMRWDASKDVLDLVQLLSGFGQLLQERLSLPPGSLPMSVLYHLLTLVREHREQNVWIMPKLAYLFGRFTPKAEYGARWQKLNAYVFSNSANWQHLEVALLWNLMMIRKGGNQNA